MFSASIGLELSCMQGVHTLSGDSRVDQGVQGAPEALGPKWLSVKSTAFRLGVERHGCVCGARGDPSFDGEAP
jgi:hypothetical protein